jgi:hypothetical protein
VGEGSAERDELAATFRHPGVAGAYRHRPPYPADVFDILERIITDRPRRVLDIGAGEGALARPLADRVDHAVGDLVRPYAVDGVLDLPVAAELAWGRITVTAGR